MPARALVVAGVLLLLGVLVGLGGFVLRVAVAEAVRGGIRDLRVVDSPTAPGTHNFLHRNDSGVPVYYTFYPWHLKNPKDVLAGKKPRYQEMGPYTYMEIYDKIDVKYLDDNKVMRYQEQHQFVFQPHLSKGDPAKDTMTNINVGYIGVLSQAGSEVALPFATIGPALGIVRDYFNTVFIDYILARDTPALLTTVQQRLVSKAGSVAAFCDVWANTASPPDPDWQDMLVSQGSVYGPSGISADACAKLFDASVADSLLNVGQSSYMAWVDARATGKADVVARLVREFALTSEQVYAVASWLDKHFRAVRVTPIVLAKYRSNWPKLKNLRDVAYLQWATGEAIHPTEKPLKAHSILEVFPHAFPAVPEYGVWSRVNGTWYQPIEIAHAEKLLAGKYAITDPLNFVEFLKSSTHPHRIRDMWGLTTQEYLSFDAYIGRFFVQYFSSPLLCDALDNLGSVITTRVVEDVLFHGVDPLVNMLSGPVLADIGLVSNDSSPERARLKSPVVDVYTGRGSLGDAGEVKLWQGSSTVDLWPTPAPVFGSNADAFPPGVQLGARLAVVSKELFRTTFLDWVAEDTIKGVPTYLYYVAPDDFTPNAAFANDILGFCNMAPTRLGAPIYLSKPHFLGAGPKYLNRVDGLNPTQAEHDTFVWIEPITGMPFKANKRLQVNAFVASDPDHFRWNLINPDIYKDCMYPIVWIEQHAIVPDEQAEQFRSTVMVALMIEQVSQIGGIAAALLFIVPGVMKIRAYRREQAQAQEDAADETYYQQLIDDESAAPN